MGVKLGEIVRKIQIENNLSQEELGKELGYTSRSAINKIEKGVNDISFEKFMLLVEKFNLDINSLFDKEKISFDPLNEESIFYLSFSGKDKGNSSAIANHLMNGNDKFISFKDLSYNPCAKCEYECFKSECKYRYDDIYDLIDSMIKYKKIVFIVPMYASNPSSLYFIFNERMQDYFSHNEDKWNIFIDKLNIIAIYGSSKETPLFIPTLAGIFDGNQDKILKIERHKYNLKMDDNVIDNKELVDKIDDFFKNNEKASVNG